MESSDLRLLVVLDALLQEGSVTGAARRMGLSTPAMSHALARVRAQLGDPILVRAGRGMLLTPRAEELKGRVHAVVAEARRTLEPARPFDPAALDRTFVVHATDYVLTVLGLVVDRRIRAAAPGVGLRYLPNSPEDAARLRDGGADLAVGIYADLPAEMRTRVLLTDRLVTVLRRGHPALDRRLTLERFVRLLHLQVAPRGAPGGYVDDVLGRRGLSRRVALAVPYFSVALELVAQTDYVLTVPERIAARFARTLPLVVVEAPLGLRPYALSLVWHPRFDGDPGHEFLRGTFVAAAAAAAGDRHEAARTRLAPVARPRRGGARKVAPDETES